MDWYLFCVIDVLLKSFSIWFKFIKKENGNPMNIASLYSASLLDASTKTQPVEPVIYRPELKRNDKSYQYLRTPKFDSDWLYRNLFVLFFKLSIGYLKN